MKKYEEIGIVRNVYKRIAKIVKKNDNNKKSD